MLNLPTLYFAFHLCFLELYEGMTRVFYNISPLCGCLTWSNFISIGKEHCNNTCYALATQALT